MKIEVSEKTAKFLLQLFENLEKTDPRCTASPFFIQVRSLQETGVPEGCGVEKRYFSGFHAGSYTLDDVEIMFNELTDTEKEEYENDIGYYINAKFDEYEIDYKPVDENIFLTDAGFKEHMECNGHNYRHLHKTFSYVKHAFKNKEIEGLVSAIKEIGKILKSKKSIYYKNCKFASKYGPDYWCEKDFGKNNYVRNQCKVDRSNEQCLEIEDRFE